MNGLGSQIVRYLMQIVDLLHRNLSGLNLALLLPYCQNASDRRLSVWYELALIFYHMMYWTPFEVTLNTRYK